MKLPKLDATRLIASVVPRVKITSEVERALIHARTFSRVASRRAVASCATVKTPRCTLALWLKYISSIASTTQRGVCEVAVLSRYTSGRPYTSRLSIGYSRLSASTS